MSSMNQQPKPVTDIQAVNDELLLDADELKQLAKLFDVLMEVDFEQNRNAGLVSNAY